MQRVHVAQRESRAVMRTAVLLPHIAASSKRPSNVTVNCIWVTCTSPRGLGTRNTLSMVLKRLVVPGTRLAMMVSPGLGVSSYHGLLLQWHGPPVPAGLRSGCPEEVHLPVGL